MQDLFGDSRYPRLRQLRFRHHVEFKSIHLQNTNYPSILLSILYLVHLLIETPGGNCSPVETAVSS